VTDSELRVRPAVRGDLGAIKAIVRDAYAVYIPRIGREPGPMGWEYAALVDGDLVWVATAEDEEAVVGVLVLRPEPDHLLLENVAVAPAEQGRGVGRRLIEYAEQHARALGLPEVTLYTHERMTENRRLYASLGYVERDRSTDEGFRRVYFRKPVG
jgi:ribosomal protein S18 acetylase RimI-like enzyme